MNTKRFNADGTQAIGDYQTWPARDLNGNWPRQDQLYPLGDGYINISLPTTPNIPLPQSTGNDLFYFLLPSGHIIKRTILSVSPIEKYKWKVQFIDSQEIVIINNKEDYLALRKMLASISD